MGTLGKKILESLKVLPKWLTRQLLKLINLITDSGRLVPRGKFLEEDGYKRFLSRDGICGEAVEPLFGIVFQDKGDKMQLYCVLNQLLDLYHHAYFFEFFNKNVCVLTFNPIEFWQYGYELRFKLIVIAGCFRMGLRFSVDNIGPL